MLLDFVRDISQFQQGEILSKSTFGSVCKGVEKATGRPVAIKLVLRPVNEEQEEQQLIRELSILATNEYPGTLRLIGFQISRDSRQPIIVTELLANGTLQDVIMNERRSPVPEWDATKKSICVFGVAAAMAYLHSGGILHRDLKPSNILLNGSYEPVIGDFALAVHYSNELESHTGTTLFMAPEVIKGEKCNFPSEVYSFAVTLYSIFETPDELSDGEKAQTSFQLARKVTGGIRFAKKPGIPDFYWQLIESCWQQDPNKRPQFHNLVDDFRQSHAYVLPGANLAQVQAYEEKVYRKFGPPAGADLGEPFGTPEKIHTMIEQLINAQPRNPQ
jgi:serine/threonine protein kinase